MMGMVIAPQYGINCSLVPKTDNPACPDVPKAPTAETRRLMAEIRARAAADWEARRRLAPTVWYRK